MRFIHAWARFNGHLLCTLARRHHGAGFGPCRRCSTARYYCHITAGANKGRAYIPVIDDHGATITLGAILNPMISTEELTITSIYRAELK